MEQIPPKFLKDGAEVLALPLGNITNLSIKLSTIPQECKIAKLNPIFLLPLVSKIIEKSIHFQIEDYLNKKKLIYMYQSGFRTNHSTDLCRSVERLCCNWYGLTDAYRYDISRSSESI